MVVPKYIYRVSFNTLGGVVHIEDEYNVGREVAQYSMMLKENKKSRILDFLKVPCSGRGFNIIPSHRIYIAEIVSDRKLDNTDIKRITIDLVKKF